MVKLFSKNSNLCDHNPPTLQTDRRPDGQTDRQTTCDCNTALCTKVHRAVKTVHFWLKYNGLAIVRKTTKLRVVTMVFRTIGIYVITSTTFYVFFAVFRTFSRTTTRMTISLQRVIRSTSCFVLGWGLRGRRI